MQAVLPVLIPLATAAVTACSAHHRRWQQGFSWLGALAFFAVAAQLTITAAGDRATRMAFGHWPVPMAIEFHIDRTSALLLLVAATLGLAVLLSLHGNADSGPRRPSRLPLLHGTLAGVAGAFCTADLFNLYVWFELMLICALGLLAMGRRPDQLDAAFKYLGLNLFGTLLLLAGIGLVYGATGQLNYTAVGVASRTLDPAMRQALIALLGMALLLKAAAFPLCAWLPASYHTLPAPALALLAGLLTKTGVYALLRLAAEVFHPVPPALSEALGWVAAATMLAGVLGAAYHWDLRRILAFHIVSQIGYILMAIALGGHGAALFYTVHHILVKANLFLIAGMVFALTGSYDLRRIGGLYAARPGLALLFAVPALSLVGVPPLSGFWSKLLVLQVALAQGRPVWAALVLVVGVLTMYSMTKVWMEAFWKPHPHPEDMPTGARAPRLGPAWVAIAALAALTLWIGLDPQPLLAYVQAAAAGFGSEGVGR